MSVKAAFEAARKEKRCAFIPYLTAGDPDFKATFAFVKALSECGADVIELGMPFSDPVADGPTNQLAATRALNSGTTLPGLLKLVSELRSAGVRTPIVIFTYLNPVFRMGYEAFAKAAVAAGANAALIVDLPPEEAAREYVPAARAAGLETIFLASPTTARDRLGAIDAATTGFLYYVSRAGVTGARSELATNVTGELDALRSAVKNPVAVGFGISTAAHAASLKSHADGVIVGSAIVKLIETKGLNAEDDIRALATSIVKELKSC